MSGLIGATNKFGQQFNNPDPNLQGIIVSIYGWVHIQTVSNEMADSLRP